MSSSPFEVLQSAALLAAVVAGLYAATFIFVGAMRRQWSAALNPHRLIDPWRHFLTNVARWRAFTQSRSQAAFFVPPANCVQSVKSPTLGCPDCVCLKLAFPDLGRCQRTPLTLPDQGPCVAGCATDVLRDAADVAYFGRGTGCKQVAGPGLGVSPCAAACVAARCASV